jgi:hypothetical protein
MVNIKELKDFKDTPYYKYYTDMINEYWVKVIRSIVDQQWIDTEKKYTRWDVLRETLKFINTDLKDFKDLEIINPSRTEIEKQEMDEAVKEQTKSYLGMT